MREEVSLAVAKHDVGDDLLVARVVFDLSARHEQVPFANHRLMAVEVVADEAMPRTIREDVLPPHAKNPLGSCSHF
jgi:hypothetical protein